MIVTVEEIYTVKYVVSSDDYTQEQALQLVKDRKADSIHSEFKELNSKRLAQVRTITDLSWWGYELIRGTGKFGWTVRSRKEV